MSIELRRDYSANELRSLARRTKDGPQARRLLALASVYEGGTRTEASRIGNVTLQVVRDWVLRFNKEGPGGLIDKKAPGKEPLLKPRHRKALAKAIEDGPIPSVHGVVRWRLIDLGQWLHEEFGIAISKPTLSREVRALGFRKLTARPRHHEQKAGAIEAFKKTSMRAWRKSRQPKTALRPVGMRLVLLKIHRLPPTLDRVTISENLHPHHRWTKTSGTNSRSANGLTLKRRKGKLRRRNCGGFD